MSCKGTEVIEDNSIFSLIDFDNGDIIDKLKEANPDFNGKISVKNNSIVLEMDKFDSDSLIIPEDALTIKD